MAGHTSGGTLRAVSVRAMLFALAMALPLLGSAGRAFAILGLDPDTGVYALINDQIGATRFYDSGYYGQRSVVANVEAGHIWDKHEMLLGAVGYYFQDPTTAQPQPQYDRHATAVGSIIAGLGPPNDQGLYYYYQFGIAPLASLWSGAVATQFLPDGAFETTPLTLRFAYQQAMTQTVFHFSGNNLYITGGADVLNSSWGYPDATASQSDTLLIDSMVSAYHKPMFVAAGNARPGQPPQPVTGPASGFNTIAVGALDMNPVTGIYDRIATYSNRGPNDFYNPRTGATIHSVRPAVDLLAPGSLVVTAEYLGATGGYDPNDIAPNPQPTDQYQVGSGTSFASPIAAAGAGLLADAAWDRFGGGEALDGRVIRAVLMNSADELPGWTNHAANVAGVSVTTQGLDWAQGAGKLDLSRAYDQFLSGTTDVAGTGGGLVQRIGWDFGHVAASSPDIYNIGDVLSRSSRVTATLTWFANRSFDALNNAGSDVSFDNLTLELWRTDSGSLSQLVAASRAQYNNVQHIDFALPETGHYALRVGWNGFVYDLPGNSAQSDDFALAWNVTAVPGPGRPAMLIGGVALMSAIGVLRMRRRRVTA